jgi:hypothetical protein
MASAGGDAQHSSSASPPATWLPAQAANLTDLGARDPETDPDADEDQCTGIGVGCCCGRHSGDAVPADGLSSAMSPTCTSVVGMS